MRILITGSNGFVGSRLMYYLEERGEQVWGIDRSTDCNYKTHPNTMIGDIRFMEDLRKLPGAFDLIIHAAAEKHDFGVSGEAYFDTNEGGTRVLMQYADEIACKKVIYYSTVSVYGHQDKPCDETAEYKSNTIYGDSKFAGEKVIWEWMKNDASKEVVTLRPSVIYGTYNFANMYNLIHQMYTSPKLMIGSGNNIKSMVALDNLCDMTYFMFDKMKPGVQNLNCIDKPYVTVNDVMKIVAKTKGFQMPSLRIPYFIAYSIGLVFDVLGKITGKDYRLNSDRVTKFVTATDYRAEKIREMGYVQQHSIEDAMTRMVEWYVQDKNKA